MQYNNHSSAKQNPRYALLASVWALGTVFILIIIKTYAYYVSGSAAVLGTLVDSVIDGAISIMLFFAVRLSLKPATKEHRFGHGKIEGIAALLQGAFMAGAGLFLAMTAFENFLNPQVLTHHKTAIIIAAIAVVMSMIVVAVQKFVLNRAPSLAIEADQAHYKTDVCLNLVVILALVIDYYGGYRWVDSVFALFIAAYFIRTAYKISNRSIDMLMDKELPANVRMRLEQLISSHPGIHGMHDLRTRLSGMTLYIGFDVEIDPDMPLKQAHDIVAQLDLKILEHYPNAEILIHMDPIGDTDDPRHNQLS